MLLAVKRRASASELDYGKMGGLVPVVVQDVSCGQVLMVGFASREAVERTLQTGLAWFYSRSRRRLWMKGETSGNRVHVYMVLADCDLDSLVYIGRPEGPVCHTGLPSCFHNIVSADRLFEEAYRSIRRLLAKARVAGGRLVSPLTTGDGALPPWDVGVIAQALVVGGSRVLGGAQELVMPPWGPPHIPVMVAQSARRVLRLEPGSGGFVAVASYVDGEVLDWARENGAEAIVAALAVDVELAGYGYWLAEARVEDGRVVLCRPGGRRCEKLVAGGQ